MEVGRVQCLASGLLKELPAQFIRPSHERPENTKAVEGVTVPVISLSLPHDLLVEQIAEAASEWGIFLITDHGISPTLIARLQELGQKFFALPQKEKEAYANDPSTGSFEGYGTRKIKNLDEKVEWIDYYFDMMSPSSKEVTEEYNKQVLKLTDKVLGLLSEGLGLERKALKSSLGDEKMEMEMKINMYPPCPQPELALGVEPHTDMSALTLLVPNDVHGLQVWRQDHWVAVDFLQNTLLVHVGDQLEVLSNGKYKSVLHRSLVNKERTRMLWAVFVVPPHEAVIGPLSVLVNQENPPKFSTKTFAEFRHRKFNKLPQWERPSSPLQISDSHYGFVHLYLLSPTLYSITNKYMPFIVWRSCEETT